MNICWRRTRACDTAVIHRETVDYGSPNVSRLPLGNFQMQRNVGLQELEQVAKVRD